jgi:glycosyltransferase involved in cell wall biosynthesis
VRLAIGIDARKIRDGGIGRYLQGLLGALASQDGPEHYVLFLADETRGALPGDLGSRLAADRFRLVRCPAPLYSIRELFAFRGAATRSGLGLLHFPHYVRAFDPGCPVAVTIHDAIHLSHPPSPAAAFYARAMLTWSARTAAALFTPSESARRDLAARLRVPATRFRVAPNGVDPMFSPPSAEERASFRRARGLERDYVLCLGTHRRHKNVPAAVAGFAAAALPEGELVIPAPTDGDAERLRLWVRPGVRVLAPVADRELPLLYACSRLVLAPSVAEGFGLGPLEAAACGAPVLATAIPAHREVLGDAAAFIAGAAGPAEIADALRSLWESEERRRDLSARGPGRASRFPWSVTAASTLAGYREAATGAGSAAPA